MDNLNTRRCHCTVPGNYEDCREATPQTCAVNLPCFWQQWYQAPCYGGHAYFMQYSTVTRSVPACEAQTTRILESSCACEQCSQVYSGVCPPPLPCRANGLDPEQAQPAQPCYVGNNIKSCNDFTQQTISNVAVGDNPAYDSPEFSAPCPGGCCGQTCTEPVLAPKRLDRKTSSRLVASRKPSESRRTEMSRQKAESLKPSVNQYKDIVKSSCRATANVDKGIGRSKSNLYYTTTNCKSTQAFPLGESTQTVEEREAGVGTSSHFISEEQLFGPVNRMDSESCGCTDDESLSGEERISINISRPSCKGDFSQRPSAIRKWDTENKQQKIEIDINCEKAMSYKTRNLVRNSESYTQTCAQRNKSFPSIMSFAERAVSRKRPCIESRCMSKAAKQASSMFTTENPFTAEDAELTRLTLKKLSQPRHTKSCRASPLKSPQGSPPKMSYRNLTSPKQSMKPSVEMSTLSSRQPSTTSTSKLTSSSSPKKSKSAVIAPTSKAGLTNKDNEESIETIVEVPAQETTPEKGHSASESPPESDDATRTSTKSIPLRPASDTLLKEYVQATATSEEPCSMDNEIPCAMSCCDMKKIRDTLKQPALVTTYQNDYNTPKESICSCTSELDKIVAANKEGSKEESIDKPEKSGSIDKMTPTELDGDIPAGTEVEPRESEAQATEGAMTSTEIDGDIPTGTEVEPKESEVQTTEHSEPTVGSQTELASEDAGSIDKMTPTEFDGDTPTGIEVEPKEYEVQTTEYAEPTVLSQTELALEDVPTKDNTTEISDDFRSKTPRNDTTQTVELAETGVSTSPSDTKQMRSLLKLPAQVTSTSNLNSAAKAPSVMFKGVSKTTVYSSNITIRPSTVTTNTVEADDEMTHTEDPLTDDEETDKIASSVMKLHSKLSLPDNLQEETVSSMIRSTAELAEQSSTLKNTPNAAISNISLSSKHINVEETQSPNQSDKEVDVWNLEHSGPKPSTAPANSPKNMERSNEPKSCDTKMLPIVVKSDGMRSKNIEVMASQAPDNCGCLANKNISIDIKITIPGSCDDKCVQAECVHAESVQAEPVQAEVAQKCH